MPPKRPTRSARTSVEPAQSTSKRKRSGPTDDGDNDFIAEEENVKPPSRSTRRSSAAPTAPSKKASSTRSARALKEVQQEEDEEEDVEDESPRPLKKARSSNERDSDDEIQEIPPPRSSRVTQPRGSSAKEPIVVDTSDDEQAPPPKTRKPPSRKPSVQPSSRGTTPRASRAASRTVKTEPQVQSVAEEDENTEGLAEPPVKIGPPKRGSRTSAPSSRASALSSRKSASSSKKVKKEPSHQPLIEEEEEEGDATTKQSENGRSNRRGAQSVRPQSHPSRVPKGEPMDEDEDEVALPKHTRKPKISVESPEPSEAGPSTLTNPRPSSNGFVPPPGNEEDQDDVSFLDVPPRTPKKEKGKSPARSSSSQPLQPEVEEKSLLDALSQSPRKTAPPPPPVEEPQGPVPRLTIHKLVLINFKSYAGRQEIGPFHKSFSAIVGPNGSGKSNTIDALLFVFGYRASKMRQGKLSELIHNSAQFPDLEECSVEVHFRDLIDLPGPNEYEVIPNSGLVVRRTAFRDNKSKYTINGRGATYKDVQTLLKGRGIDLDHNRFLILQGEVESIAQMKPKAPSEHEDGLLEYLEDIIGTAEYKANIEQALEDLEQLQDQRTERMGRLRHVENEKAALEKEKKAAEEYLKRKNDFTRAQSRLWQWIIWQCLQNEEKWGVNRDKINRVLTAEREKNHGNIQAQENIQAEYDERDEALNNLKKAMKAAVDDFKKHENDEVKLGEKHSQSVRRLEKLQKAVKDDAKALKTAQRGVKDNTSKIESENENLKQLDRDLLKEEKLLEDICESIKDKTQVFYDEIEKKQRELQPWTAKLQQKQAEVDVRVSERDMLMKKAESRKQALVEAEAKLQSLQDEQVQKVEESANLKARQQAVQQQKSAAEREQRDLSGRVNDLRKTASSHRQRMDEARASQASAKSGNQVLNALNSLSSSGRIYGFHGRLGGLGAIDAKYDIAVTTACPQLNNMVVETVEQAQQCIDYIRKQNVGRATFLILEKIDRQPQRVEAPLPRLFDLVKPRDPKFMPAFYKALGNTLVARDIDEANRVAIGNGGKRWRVVTLDGQLVDTSGTMSGGGTTVARGGMSDKFASQAASPNEMRKLEQDAERAAAQLQEAQEELRRVEIQLEQLHREGPQVDMDIRKLEMEVQTVQKRIADAEKSVRELRAQSKPDANDQKRISTLEEEIASANAAVDDLTERAGVIEQAIKDLNKKVDEAGGSRLLVQRSKVDGIRIHINLANEEITKAEVSKAKAEKDVARLEKAIEGHGESIGAAEEEAEKLRSELEDIQSKVTEYKELVAKATTAVEEAKDELEELKAELEEKIELTRAFRKHELELQQQLDDLKKESDANKQLMDSYAERHDELQLEDIDDEDDEEEDLEQQQQQQGEPMNEDGVSGQVIDKKPSRSGRQREDAHTLPTYQGSELARMDKKELLADVSLLDDELKKTKPNPGVLKEYRKREEEFLRRAKDLEDTTTARDAQKLKYDTLCKQRLDQFMNGFATISSKLKEMYQMITLGGNAELELVDSMDPFSEGIIFSVMPPKKSWRNISNLSGGEKTLSSLALVFALHVYKPTPLYFMDEIDAALDFRNVSIVANYIKDRTKNAQFIIISLRNDMFELSQRLIGIYKTSNQTRSISIDNHNLHNSLPGRATATPAPTSAAGPSAH